MIWRFFSLAFNSKLLKGVLFPTSFVILGRNPTHIQTILPLSRGQDDFGEERGLRAMKLSR